jgi:hypothetical protein
VENGLRTVAHSLRGGWILSAELTDGVATGRAVQAARR